MTAIKPIKFLLVDDLDANLIALEGLLRRPGVELHKAKSGQEALELLLIHDFALALLDVQMPGMNGFELAEFMRGSERTRRVPIIFLTAGAADTERRFQGYEAGAVDFLFKPVDPHMLRSKAEVFFDLARQRDELHETAEQNARLVVALKQAQQQLEEHARQLEIRVRERTASLEETNNHLEAFSYTIAHDLRAPLRSQRAFAQALLDDYGPALGETGRDYADRIKAAAARLENLVNDLLAFSRISRAEIKLERIELGDLVARIRDDLSFQINEAGAKVEIGSLPFAICAHESSLRAAVTNLLTNALKFRRNDVPPRINISAEKHGKFIRLTVADNGIGIAAEHMDQIFGVFHRLHPEGQFPGTGVGLAIVKKAIERMGGQVGLVSELNFGSRFWLDLVEAS